MSEENPNPSAPAEGAPPFRRRRPSRRRPQRRRSNGARNEQTDSETGEQPERAEGPENLREDRSAEGDRRREEAGEFAEVAQESGENRPREDESRRERNQGGNQNGAELPREPEFGDGIIEISGKGFGFLRDAKRNFVQTPNDIFVTPEIVRRFQLRDGMWIHGEIRKGNRGPQLTRLLKINDE